MTAYQLMMGQKNCITKSKHVVDHWYPEVTVINDTLLICKFANFIYVYA